jgi:hypothetical protein
VLHLTNALVILNLYKIVDTCTVIGGCDLSQAYIV